MEFQTISQHYKLTTFIDMSVNVLVAEDEETGKYFYNNLARFIASVNVTMKV